MLLATKAAPLKKPTWVQGPSEAAFLPEMGPSAGHATDLHSCRQVFLTAMKMPLLRRRTSPDPARGRSRIYNWPRPALPSVSALTAQKQPPSLWQPVTSAPPFPTSMPCGQPLRQHLEGGRERGAGGENPGLWGNQGESELCGGVDVTAGE